VSEAQLTLAAVEAGEEVELVDVELVTSVRPVASAGTLSPSPPPVSAALGDCNLFGEAERIAVRAARPSTSPPAAARLSKAC
jgi:hypothetical protein